MPTVVQSAIAGLMLVTGALSAETVNFTPTDEDIPNPERGFYAVGSGNGSIAQSNYDAIAAGGYTLAYGRIDLQAHATEAIPDALLHSLDAGFANARNAGVKVIVRIVYNDGFPASGPPVEASPVQLRAHLEQLQPVFETNRDVIAFFQAGIIGAWGEWHSTSQYIENAEDYEQYNTATVTARRYVINELLTYIPEGRFVQIRRPWFKDPAFGAEAIFPGLQVDETSAFSAEPVARVGHHNDCFLASASDFGTYRSDMLEEQKLFLASDTRYVPLGGETCNPDIDFANCGNALAEMESLRWTYMNALYHPDVIDEFETSGCLPEISRRLGYRFELLSASLPTELIQGEAHPFSITLQNTGFAPMYNERPVFLLMQDDAGNVLQEIPVPTADPRRWLPGEHTITGEFVPSLQEPLPSEVTISLWLPDESAALRSRAEYSVRFANENVWDIQQGANRLARDIPFSTKARNSDAWFLN